MESRTKNGKKNRPKSHYYWWVGIGVNIFWGVCVRGMKTLNAVPVSQSEFIFSNFFLESFTDAVDSILTKVQDRTNYNPYVPHIYYVFYLEKLYCNVK